MTSSTAEPVQTGPLGGAPLRTNLFGCAPNSLAIPWFHFEPTFANGTRDPWHANSDMAIGHPPRFFVAHSWTVCRPRKRPAHSEHQGEPKIETWPFWFGSTFGEPVTGPHVGHSWRLALAFGSIGGEALSMSRALAWCLRFNSDARRFRHRRSLDGRASIAWWSHVPWPWGQGALKV